MTQKHRRRRGSELTVRDLLAQGLRRTLFQLTGREFDRPNFKSDVAENCRRLWRTPLEEFRVEDLRLMIAQDLGIDQLMPLALDRLEVDPLVAGDFYEGDLLSAVLGVDPGYWTDKARSAERIDAIVATLTEARLREADVVDELHDDLAAFRRSRRSTGR